MPPHRVVEIVQNVIDRTTETLRLDGPVIHLVRIDNANAVNVFEAEFFPRHSHDREYVAMVSSTLLQRIWYAFFRHGIDVPVQMLWRSNHVWRQAFPERHAHNDSLVDLRATLGESPLFTDFDTPALDLLARGARRLLFAPGELLAPLEPPRFSLFQVTAGSIRIKLAADAFEIDESEFADDAQDAHVARHHRPPEAKLIDKIVSDLMPFVGPVAPLLVQSALQDTTDPYRLYRRLGRHIEDEEERQAFLVNAPDFAFEQRGIGACFD